MKVAIPLFCFGICLVVGAPEKTFPCNFNIYDKTKDGKITKAEFFEYTDKHGYNAEHSSLVFRTLDSNADGQIEVSEFVTNVPTLQKLSLISRCKRFQITIIIKCCKSSALVGSMMTSNGLQRPDMISGSNLLQNQLGQERPGRFYTPTAIKPIWQEGHGLLSISLDLELVIACTLYVLLCSRQN